MSPVTRSAPSLTRMSSHGGLAALAVTTAALLVGGALPAQAVVLDPTPGETVTVDFPYTSSGEQYTWVVPAGVTEITVELAAGSGAGEAPSVGGAGGYLVAIVPVVAGDTLLVSVGAQGALGPPRTGGEGSGIATAQGDLLGVAGGGGAGFVCGSPRSLRVGIEVCAPGGAGGFSVGQPGGSGAHGGAGRTDVPAPSGEGASTSGPGVSIGTIVEREQRTEPIAPSGTAATVDGGTLTLSPPTDPPPESESVPENRDLAGGGGGYFAGGHGGVTTTIAPGPNLIVGGGGGGGGSGYLVEGAEIVELRDNVGDGFASISYFVPEPEVVEDVEPEVRTLDPEPELVDATEPTLQVSATEVRAGDQLELSGGGFARDRTYPIILNSDPVLLGDTTTDARGTFATTVTIPASVHPGEHVISVGEARIPIRVLAADAAPAPQEEAPQPELAATGTAEDIAAAGLAALTLLGLGAVVLRRARQTEHVE